MPGFLPVYFSLGPSYSPERGFVRCDSETVSYLVAATGDAWPLQYLTLRDCEKRVSEGRMSETTKGYIDLRNDVWRQMDRTR